MEKNQKSDVKESKLKTGLAVAGVCAVTVLAGVGIYFGVKTGTFNAVKDAVVKNAPKSRKALEREVAVLTEKCAELQADCDAAIDISAHLMRENDELRVLCLEKDLWMDEAGSELLRRGSSLGGKIMADKKAYLNGK